MIETPRLRLHGWDDRHRDAFAAMHANAEVMADYGGPSTVQRAMRNSSDTLLLNAIIAFLDGPLKI